MIGTNPFNNFTLGAAAYTQYGSSTVLQSAGDRSGLSLHQILLSIALFHTLLLYHFLTVLLV